MLHKTTGLIFAILVIFTPVIVGNALLYLYHQKTLLDAVPFWSDELYHWHQAATFAEAGFDGGYYTLDEVPSRTDFSRFYAWGPFAYVIYGSFARLFGWSLASMAIVNSVLLTVALGIYVFWLRLEKIQFVFLAFILATFAPLIIYFPSSMLQVMHLSIAVVLATGFTLVMKRRTSQRMVIGFALFIIAAGLIRPTWVVFLFPLAFLQNPQWRWSSLIRAALLSGIPIILTAGVFFAVAADFPHYRSAFIGGEDGSLLDSLVSILQYMQYNLSLTFDGPTTAVVQRGQIGLLVIFVVLVMVWRGWQKKQGTRQVPILEWDMVFHLFNLGTAYILTNALHEALDGRDYRVLAPHLFLSILLLVAMNRRRIVGVMIVTCLLLIPAVLQQYQEGTTPRFNGIVRDQYDQWNAVLDDVLHYDEHAPDGWCNTVITSFFYVIPYAGDAGLVLAVDPGLGLSWAWDWQSPDFLVPERFHVPEQFKSRYLILTDDDVAAWQTRLNVHEMVRVQNGALYENLDAAC